MSTAPGTEFSYAIEHGKTEEGFNLTIVKCQGRLISENAEQLRQVVRPLILQGGRIAIDFADLDYMDSAGLGAVVSLKVSAISRGLCVLELVNLTPRIKKLLTITNLMELFTT
jgi:anti-anti-sigma factor